MNGPILHHLAAIEEQSVSIVGTDGDSVLARLSGRDLAGPSDRIVVNTKAIGGRPGVPVEGNLRIVSSQRRGSREIPILEVFAFKTLKGRRFDGRNGRATSVLSSLSPFYAHSIACTFFNRFQYGFGRYVKTTVSTQRNSIFGIGANDGNGLQT